MRHNVGMTPLDALLDLEVARRAVGYPDIVREP